jgi:endonuclease/exonuclease/phosphatase family metal-dependent hydrolase
MKFLLALSLMLSLSAWAGLKVGTYNIRNFDYDVREDIQTNKPELVQILLALNFDLLGVNEINNGEELASFIKSKMPNYEVVLSKCGGRGGQSLGFIYNSKKLRLLDFKEELGVTNPEGQPTCNGSSRPMGVGKFEVLVTKEIFYSYQVHLKAGDNAEAQEKRALQYEFLKNYFKLAEAEGKTNYIVMGDFNTTGYLSRDQDYKKFSAMLNANKLSNLTAQLGCSAYWWGATDDNTEIPSKLDHIVMSPGFLELKGTTPKAQVHGHCKKVTCKPASSDTLGVSYQEVSDHCPMTVEI